MLTLIVLSILLCGLFMYCLYLYLTPTLTKEKYAYPHRGIEPLPENKLKYDKENIWHSPSGVGHHMYISQPEPGQPREATLIFLGDLRSGGSRFTHLAIRLKEWGITTYVLDAEGFGQSDGVPGELVSPQILISSVLAFTNHVCDLMAEEAKDSTVLRPSLLVGGSGYGATLAMALCIAKPGLFKATLLFNPVLANSSLLLKYLEGPLLLLASMIPCWRLIDPIPLDLTTANWAVPRMARLQGHKYAHTGKWRTASVAHLLLLSKLVQDRLEDMNTPFALFQGQEDMVSDLQTNNELLKRSRYLFSLGLFLLPLPLSLLPLFCLSLPST